MHLAFMQIRPNIRSTLLYLQQNEICFLSLAKNQTQINVPWKVYQWETQNWYCIMKCCDLQQVCYFYYCLQFHNFFKTGKSHTNRFVYFATFIMENWLMLKYHSFLNMLHSRRVRRNTTNEFKCSKFIWLVTHKMSWHHE